MWAVYCHRGSEQLLPLFKVNLLKFGTFSCFVAIYVKRWLNSWTRRGIILQEVNPMCGVFRNIDPPHRHRSASVYPPPLVRGEDTLAVWRGGGGSIVWKTPDTALYSRYVSTLWLKSICNRSQPRCLKDAGPRESSLMNSWVWCTHIHPRDRGEGGGDSGNVRLTHSHDKMD